MSHFTVPFDLIATRKISISLSDGSVMDMHPGDRLTSAADVTLTEPPFVEAMENGSLEYVRYPKTIVHQRCPYAVMAGIALLFVVLIYVIVWAVR